jgi:hypothetical protein
MVYHISHKDLHDIEPNGVWTKIYISLQSLPSKAHKMYTPAEELGF